MRSPGRIVVLSLAAALVAAAGVTSVPATSAVSAPAAASPRSAPDGILGSFSALARGITDPDRPTWPVQVTAVARWDGKIIAGYDKFGRASGVAGTNLIAAYSAIDDTWRPLGTGISSDVDYPLVSLVALTDDTLVAGGLFSSPNSASGVPNTRYLAAWSDDTWRPLGDGVTNRVDALAKWADDTLLLGGSFPPPSITASGYITAWSNGTWRPFGTGVLLTLRQPSVSMVAPWTRNTFVINGEFESASGVANTTNAALWSSIDDTWRPFAAGTAAALNLQALAAWTDDTFIVGGLFPSAGGVPGTTNIAAWSTTDDTWHDLGGGLNGIVRSVAVDDTRGLIYAGGGFRTSPDDSVSGIGVWDTGISEWIPFRFAAGTNGQGVFDPYDTWSILVEDSVVYLVGDFRNTGFPITDADGIAKWTWQPPQGSSTFTTLGTAVTGEGLVGVPATGGVKVGTATATYTRDDSTHITITSIAGSPAAGAQITVNGVGGWGVVGTCAPPACADPNPPAPIPPSAPGSATATAGDASATVTWTAPTAPGSFPVTNYQVTSSPGDRSCLTSALTCTVTGLTNGTTYTFTVKALSGAGWGANSTPSNAVTPTGVPKPSIMITGSRDGQRITVTGTSMHLTSQTVRPWLRFPGETTYSEGAAVIPVAADGTFTWSRKSNKKTYVYIAHGTTRSNTVTIPAR